MSVCTLDGEQQALLRRLAEQGVITAGEKAQILSWLSLPDEERVVSQWQKFFGHLHIWNHDFNERRYPLRDDPGDEAEEFGFDKVVTGYEALAWFKQIKRQGASLWAQGRSIQEHPEAQKAHPLLGIGAQEWYGAQYKYFPVFKQLGDEPGVDLDSLDRKYGPHYRFLLRKEKGI